MKTFIQHGNTLDAIAPAGGVVSGALVRINSLIGVAATDAAAGETFALMLGGVHELAKTSAQAWAVGEPVYAIAGTNVLTNAAGTGNYLVGVAAAVAVNPSAVGQVRLNGTLGHPVTA